MECFFLTLRIFMTALAGADGAERTAAIDSLVASGDVAWIGQAVYDHGWRERDGLIDALEKMGQDALPVLVDLARNHPKIDAQRLAVRSLGNMGIDARSSLSLLTKTSHPDLVVEALGKVGDERDVDLVRSLLAHQHYDVRRRAALALVNLNGESAAKDLVLLLNDKHHGVRFVAAQSLVGFGDVGGNAALAHFGELSWPGQFLALQVFGQLKYAPAQKVVIGLLTDDDWYVRSAAVGALYRFEHAKPALKIRLEKENHPFIQTQLQQIFLD